MFYRDTLKPIIDFILALAALVITLPVILAVAILLYFQNKGKIFFTQLRPGKDGKPFRLIKCETMTDRTDENGQLLPDEARLTRWGKLIRKSSLDELPQLVNVIKGDISLVGPRPLLMEYLPLYDQQQKRRHEVKPGITGWAQVNGRNKLPWKQRFDHDIYYVDHLSFSFDVKILFLTVWNVLRAKGITSNTAATMEKFTGVEKEHNERENGE
jgi:undecaprenyl phosphate N,N'-diacetylbacillosamine 1-phosphate transferase